MLPRLADTAASWTHPGSAAIRLTCVAPTTRSTRSRSTGRRGLPTASSTPCCWRSCGWLAVCASLSLRQFGAPASSNQRPGGEANSAGGHRQVCTGRWAARDRWSSASAAASQQARLGSLFVAVQSSRGVPSMNYPTVNRAQEAIGGRQLEEASVDQGEARGGPCMSVLVAYRNQLIAELHVVENLIPTVEGRAHRYRERGHHDWPVAEVT